MKYRNQVVLLAVVGAAVGVGRWTAGLSLSSEAMAQPEKKEATPGAAGGMEMMQPGAEHKVLDVLVGDWKGEVKMWMDPAQEPMVSKGTIHREWVLDGHFVHEAVSGDAMGGGPAFQGIGVTGYNPVEKRYEAGWVDNMSMWITTMNGTYDASKKTFTFAGECLNGMTGKREKQRHVMDVSNPDREVMSAWTTGPDGKEFKAFEGAFERVKK
jgi:hypothetical protein